MTTAHAPPRRELGPAPPGARLAAIDAARGLAVIGMIAVNVGPRGESGVLARLVEIPFGRASMLFVVLAGIGVSLLSRSARSAQDSGRGHAVATLAWRAVILLAAGLALQLLDHDVRVILPTYAVLFLLGAAARKAPDVVLLVAAGTSLAGGPLLWLAARDLAMAEPPTLLDSPMEILAAVLVTGPYPAITWAFPFLVGMWLGRRDLHDRAVAHRLLTWGGGVAAACAIASLATTALLHRPGEGSATVVVTGAAHGQMPLWLLGATASAALVVGALLWLEARGARLPRTLVDTGQLALTLYVAHLLALAMVRPLPSTLEQGVLIAAALSLALAGAAAAWRHWFMRGPLERFMRPPPPVIAAVRRPWGTRGGAERSTAP